jgi:hypothetical protein
VHRLRGPRISRQVGWMTGEAPWWALVKDNVTWQCGRLCVVHVSRQQFGDMCVEDM